MEWIVQLDNLHFDTKYCSELSRLRKYLSANSEFVLKLVHYNTSYI